MNDIDLRAMKQDGDRTNSAPHRGGATKSTLSLSTEIVRFALTNAKFSYIDIFP